MGPSLTRHLLRLTVITLVLLTAGIGQAPSVFAQESPIDLLAYLDGFESAYVRRYLQVDEVLPESLATPTNRREWPRQRC